MTETTDTPFRPAQGGSYFIDKDGKAERREFTIGVGEDGHPDQGPAGPAEQPPKRPAKKKES